MQESIAQMWAAVWAWKLMDIAAMDYCGQVISVLTGAVLGGDLKQVLLHSELSGMKLFHSGD